MSRLRRLLCRLAVLAVAVGAASAGGGSRAASAGESTGPLHETLNVIQQKLASLDDRVQQLTRMVSTRRDV